MSRFDFYEFVGILTPGVTLVVGLSLIFPEVASFIQKENFSVGDFGILIFFSYVIGHLVQSIGNIIEEVYWWVWGGNPTDWIRTKRHKVISDGQDLELNKRLKTILKYEKVKNIRSLSKFSWKSITNEIYGHVKMHELDSRINIFNGNYGLMRGTIASLLTILVILMLAQKNIGNYYFILVGVLILAVVRMHRFAKYYARELITSFLNSPSKKAGDK